MRPLRLAAACADRRCRRRCFVSRSCIRSPRACIVVAIIMGAQGVRPEAAGPAPDLYRSDSTRYTAQNKTLQLHMATLAVQLLGVQVRQGLVL